MPPTPQQIREELQFRRQKIVAEMGSTERIARQHARGRLTIRERLDLLFDPGSFREIGTFAVSEVPNVRDRTPGDGKIGGWGAIDGRPAAACGDDVTVLHGSSSVVGGKRMKRIYEQALRQGVPYVYFGETGGARLPDALGSEGFSKIPPGLESARRRRRIPMATAIVGESFGGSSFHSAYSDFVVQVRGSALNVSSPRVIEIATGELITLQELGGVDIHLDHTGQIDQSADTEEEAVTQMKRFLSYLPSNCWELPPVLGGYDQAKPDPRIADLVPTRRQRAYDMHRVIARIVDDGEMFELKPRFGRSLITALARIGGQTVGILASNPMFNAGALDPNTCDKGTQFVCLCEAFNIPTVWLQDVPGFIVGSQPEHARLLHKAIHVPRSARADDGTQDHGRPAQSVRTRLLLTLGQQHGQRPRHRLAGRRNLLHGPRRRSQRGPRARHRQRRRSRHRTPTPDRRVDPGPRALGSRRTDESRRDHRSRRHPPLAARGSPAIPGHAAAKGRNQGARYLANVHLISLR